MHGLHLIKFLDRVPTGSSKDQEMAETVRKHCDETEKLVSKIFRPQLDTKIAANKLTKRPSVQKCISQIFGLPNQDCRRRKISNRFQSFIIRKRKVLSNNSYFTDGKGKNIENRKTKRKTCLPGTDKIEVLFKSKNWKSKRRRPLRLISKDMCKYAIHYNSKSSYELGDRNKNSDNKFCRRLHTAQVKRRKDRSKAFQTAVVSCDNKHYRQSYSDHAIQNTKENLRNSTCHHHVHQLGPTYNVIDFPNAACLIRNGSSGSLPAPRQCESQRIAKPSAFDNSKGGGDNEASLPVHGTYSVSIQPKDHLKSRPRAHVFPKHKNCRTSKIPACPIFITRSIKITLFALSVIIWFPCILIMSLLWVISYPMRPHEVIKTVRDIENCRTECCQNDDQDFWHSIYTCVAGAVKKLLRLYEELFSLMKNTNSKRNCTRLVTSRPNLLCRRNKQYPNPQKKYKLFYDKDRGWIMKPIKLRREGIEKTLRTCRETLTDDKLKKSKINLTKYENEVSKAENPSINDSQQIKKESEQTKGRDSRDRQNMNNKAEPIHCLCEKVKKPEPKNVHCLCESVQTDYQMNDSKMKNISVYSSLQKSSKFVTFDERIQPQSECLCTKHVLENISPINLRKCCSLKKTCSHNERNVKNEKAPSLPVIQRRCLCNCKSTKPMDRLNRKYVVPDKSHNKHRVRYRQRKGQKERKQTPGPKRVGKLMQFCRKFRKKAATVIKEADNKVWNCDNCEDMFVQTLRKRPWAWVHRRCPKFYPYFLIFCKFYENLAYAMLYVCTACIWCPILCWCYFCCHLFCRCVL